MCPFCVSVTITGVFAVTGISVFGLKNKRVTKKLKAEDNYRIYFKSTKKFNMKEQNKIAKPKVVSQTEWEKEIEDILEEEKMLGKKQDELNARRRRLPMVKVNKEYYFVDGDKKLNLADLFKGRKQLVVYCAMLEPGAKPCVGCSMVMDNIGHNIEHMKARDTSFAFTAPAPQNEIKELQKKMNWNAPWYTDIDRNFADDFDAGKYFALNIFLKDEENNIYRTYYTKGRGGEVFDVNLKLLDLTPYGRQETWEDSPAGWPQLSEAGRWWRLHNEYQN